MEATVQASADVCERIWHQILNIKTLFTIICISLLNLLPNTGSLGPNALFHQSINFFSYPEKFPEINFFLLFKAGQYGQSFVLCYGWFMIVIDIFLFICFQDKT